MKKLLAGVIAIGMTFSGVTSFAEEAVSEGTDVTSFAEETVSEETDAAAFAEETASEETDVKTDKNFIDCLFAKKALQNQLYDGNSEIITSYLFGNEDVISFPAYLDLNYDTEINIADLIIAKNNENVLSQYPVFSVSTLNTIARSLYTVAQEAITDFDNKGLEWHGGVYSSDQDNDMVNWIREKYTDHVLNPEIEWKVCIDYDYGALCAVVCSTENSTFSGCYPNDVPINFSIPFSDDLLSYAEGSSDISDFEQYRVTEEEWTHNEGLDIINTDNIYDFENLISDYKTNVLFREAKSLFTAAHEACTVLSNRGSDIPTGIITSEDDSDIVKLIGKINYNKKINASWYVVINDDNVPIKAVYRSKGAEISYPRSTISDEKTDEEKEITQKLDTAAGIRFDSNYIRISPELIENSVPSESWLNTSGTFYDAKQVYCAIQEGLSFFGKDKNALPSGLITSEDDSDFVKLINSFLYDNVPTTSWNAFIDEQTGSVIKAEYKTPYNTSVYPEQMIESADEE